MEFFDFLIDDTSALFDSKNKKQFSLLEGNCWTDEGHSGMILQRDCAYELKGTGFNLVTSRELSDGVFLYGNDLSEIRKDRSYARITLVSVDAPEDEQKLYDLVKKIEYVKYHCFPEGFMMRSASDSCKEAVRVSKTSINKGISFQKIGSLFINKYKEIPEVKSVSVIFVTDESVAYSKLSEFAKKSADITKALNHIMEDLNFDCNSCNLKPLCDEVEGMRELHFKASGKMGG